MKNKLQISVFFFFILIMLTLPFEGIAQKGKYNKACKANTIEAYIEFLIKYPDSEFSTDIKDRLIVLEYDKAIETNTVEGLSSFLRKYPDSKFIEEAKEKLMVLEYDKAIETNTVEGLSSFLRKYPDSKFGGEAKEKLMVLEYDKAIETNTVEGLSSFLRKYPDSKFGGEAKEKLMVLEYDKAIETNTVEGLSSFLRKYPDSKFGREAKEKLMVLEYDKAIETNTVEGLSSFLRKYPDSKFGGKAKNKLKYYEYIEQIKNIKHPELDEAANKVKRLTNELWELRQIPSGGRSSVFFEAMNNYMKEVESRNEELSMAFVQIINFMNPEKESNVKKRIRAWIAFDEAWFPYFFTTNIVAGRIKFDMEIINEAVLKKILGAEKNSEVLNIIDSVMPQFNEVFESLDNSKGAIDITKNSIDFGDKIVSIKRNF